MNCIDEKKLSAYLDGELPEQERAAIEGHLRQCAECRLEAKNLTAVSDMLGVLEGIEPEPYFTLRLKQRLTNQKPKGLARWVRQILIPAGASAAGILALLFGMVLGKAIDYERNQSSSTLKSATVAGLDSMNDFPEGSLGDVFSELLNNGGY